MFTRRYIDDHLVDARGNRFDLLRIAAAYLVLISHCWPLFGRQDEPFLALNGRDTGGDLAVSIFFVISGFLIYASAMRIGSAGRFIFSRAVRLVPGAFVCALLAVFVIGPAFTRLDLGSYFSDYRTYRYLLKNTFLISTQSSLPGMFETNFFPRAVNGSLWTLPIEIQMYALCAICVLVLNSRVAVAIAALAGLIVSSIENPVLFHPKGSAHYYWWHYGYYFFAGSLLFISRRVVLLSLPLFLALLALYVLSFRSPAFDLVGKIFVPYATLFIAFAGNGLMPKANTPDISYGVYIYAFPIQQVISSLFSATYSFVFNILLSIIVTTAFAILSWYLVEHPVLRSKWSTYEKLRLRWQARRGS